MATSGPCVRQTLRPMLIAWPVSASQASMRWSTTPRSSLPSRVVIDVELTTTFGAELRDPRMSSHCCDVRTGSGRPVPLATRERPGGM